MKILFQTPTYLPDLGGIEISTAKLAKELIKRGHEVSVLCENINSNYKKYEEIEGVKVYRFPKPFLNNQPNLLSFNNLQKEVEKYLKKFVKKNKFDIIITRTFYFIEPTKKIIPKIPLIYLQPSIGYIAMKKTAKNSPWIKKKIRRYIKAIFSYFLEKKALKKANRILSRSNTMDYIDKNIFNIKKEKIGKFTQIADLSRFKIKEKDQKFIEKLNLKNKIIILTISRLTPDKNNLEILEIAKKIKNKNIVFLIIGGGPQENELHEEIIKQKLQNNVLMFGSRKDTEKFYNISDIFITTSEQEGFPNVFLEAMASGLPIIGYKENPPKRTIPTKEFIENKGLGFAVKDKNEMIEKINLLLSNKKLIEQIKQKSSVEIKNYETKKICDNFLLEIRRLIKK